MRDFSEFSKETLSQARKHVDEHLEELKARDGEDFNYDGCVESVCLSIEIAKVAPAYFAQQNKKYQEEPLGLLGFLKLFTIGMVEGIKEELKIPYKPYEVEKTPFEKTKEKYAELSLENTNTVDLDDEESFYNPSVSLGETYDALQDRYEDNREIKTAKSEALNKLRKHLYMNNLELCGFILKSTNHNVPDESLMQSAMTGEIESRFSTTYFTFGKEIDDLLCSILPNYLTKRKCSNKECLIAQDDDYGFIEEQLKLLYNEDIKVKFDIV